MSEDDSGRLASIDWEKALPDFGFVKKDFENFNPDITISGPPFVLATVGAYSISGTKCIDRLEQRVRERSAHAKSGRFNKTDTLYSPIAPPNGAWDYRCRSCRFYQEEATENGGGRCAIVGHEEDPFGGTSISPEAWCALWLPEDGRQFLDYVKRRAEGSGT